MLRKTGSMMMRFHLFRISVLSILLLFMLPLAIAQSPQRLVTLGGSVTEIVFALGAGKLVVGTDQSSLYPLEATMLPSVGYYRHLPVEGVAAMRPSLVLASDHAGPPSAMAQIKALGIPVETVSDQPTIDSLNVRIRQIANALGLQQAGESLIMQIEQERLAAFNLPIQNRSAMLVVMRSGKLLGAGGDTAANTVIQQAGLRNVLESLKSYQAITPEAVSTLAPEVIIVTSSTVKAMGGLEQIKADLSLVHTPAVKNDRVIELEDLLAQGFGPRSAEATVKIRKALSYD